MFTNTLIGENILEDVSYRSLKVGIAVSFFTMMLLWIMIVLLMPKFNELSYVLLILSIIFGYFSGYTCGNENKMRRFMGTYLGAFFGTLVAIIFLFEVTSVEVFSSFFGLRFVFEGAFAPMMLGILFGSLSGLLAAIGATIFKPVSEKIEKVQEEES